MTTPTAAHATNTATKVFDVRGGQVTVPEVTSGGWRVLQVFRTCAAALKHADSWLDVCPVVDVIRLVSDEGTTCWAVVADERTYQEERAAGLA